MGKTCIVKSCPSGRKLKSPNNESSQLLSFFRPTTQERLDKWQKCLGIKLKATDNICQLHFKEEHIKLYDKFIFNGEVKILPAMKKLLKADALPTIEHQFVPMSPSELQARLIDEPIKSNSCHSICEDDQHDDIQNSSIEQLELSDDDINDNEQMQSDNEQMENDSEQLENYFEVPFSSLQSHHNSESHTESESDTQQLNTLKDIKNFIKLPPCWLYLDKPDRLEFLRLDPSTKETKNQICINEDFSITVVFANGEELSLDMKIDSFKNIYEFLKSIEKWPLCVGTQVESNKYSKSCKGVIICDEAYQRNQRYPRCKSCRILRKRLQSRKSTSITLEKTAAQNPFSSNLVKQNNHLKRMLKKISMRKSPSLKPSHVICSHCEETFESKKQLVLHIKSVHSPRVLQCGKCGKCFTTAASLMKHERLHEVIEKQRLHREEKARSEALETTKKTESNVSIVYKCTICDKNFAKAYNLKRHERLHTDHVSEVLKAPCTVCGKLVSSNNMKLHMRVHDNREPTKCYECNKTFVSKAGYEIHLKYTKTHAGYDAFSIKCPFCPRGFRTKSERRDHVDFWHNGVVTHKCEICDKILSSATMLAQHVKRVHSTGKKVHKRKMYLCQTCGKACRDISAFREHEALHTGEKLFSCKPCNRSYRTSTSLYLHKRRYHSETLISRYTHIKNDDDDKSMNFTDQDEDVET